jgi:hypothetical protein
MCAWIEVHQSLPTHPKVIEAAMILDVAEPVVVGHLICLWTWAMDARPDGHLDLSKPRIIARAARWDMDADRLVDTLVAVRLLDDDGCIHDWHQYTGRLMERRDRQNALNRERVRAFRERQKDRALLEAPESNADVMRYNGISNALGNAPVIHGNALPNRTQPNRTQQNPPSTKAVESVAPAPRDAPLTVVTKKPRKPDPLWDALASVWPQGPRSEMERARWNKAAQELRNGGATPDEILTAARHWPNVMGSATMTPMALANNLGMLLEGPQVNGRSSGTVVGQEVRQRLTQSATTAPDPRAEIEAHRAAKRRSTE